MSKLSDIKRLFAAGFKESPEWVDWYFSNAYDDANALISYSNAQPASCLMLEPYRLKLADSIVDIGYLSCATTAKHLRGQGYMRRLVNDALMESAARGQALVALIPASPELYFFYDRFDFSTIFFADENRYTSLHNFSFDQRFIENSPSFEHFAQLESSQHTTILHSKKNFENILTDNALDDGIVISLSEKSTSEPAAMLFATNDENAVVVRDLIYVDNSAAESILRLLRQRIGERMIIVRLPPSDSPAMLRSQGMGRIVNVAMLLDAFVSQTAVPDQVIRVRDNILSDNNAFFIIHDGHVERVSSTMRRVNLDVSVDILADILFNSREIGNIFSLPTFRPFMSLMLD